MRVSTQLRLASLCLIAGSLSAFPSPLAARSTTADPKKNSIHKEITGYGTTELLAQKNALERACEWLNDNDESGLDWFFDPEYLRGHNMVRFGKPKDKEFEEPMGRMKVVEMQLEINAGQIRDIQKQVQQHRMKERQEMSLRVLIGIVALLGVVGGYLRLEEATKGYYTRLLRIAGIGILVVIVAGLCVAG